MTSGKPSPELLAMLGLIEAEEYLRLTDAPSHREYDAAARKVIADAQHKRWAKHREKKNAH
jgi:hypothetical protein